LAALALTTLVLSCAADGGKLSLEAESDLLPRLEAMIADHPLPARWSIAVSGEKPSVAIILNAEPPGSSLPRGAYQCGTRYLAASADLADNLFSVSARRAEELGLSKLESIVLPRRALAVDGIWPGKAGYPFAQRLALYARSAQSAESSGKTPRLPTAISRWLAEAAKAAAASDPSPTDLAAAGDIQVGECQWPLLSGSEAGLVSLLRGGVLDLLRKPDIAVANLEAPISARGFPNPRKRYRFRMPPGSAAALEKAGLDLLLFGNNHGLDFGGDAFDDTLVDLEKAGLPMVGAGRDISEAARARILGTGPGRIAFVGYAFFPNETLGFTTAEAAAGPHRAGVSADEAASMEAVRRAAASGATVVVLAHGGTEYVESPSLAARKLYARFIDAGAALVAGTHPHLLQGCEARSGSLIAYSLGNFLFTGEAEPPAAWKSAILDFLVYRGKVRGLAIHPIIAAYDYTTVDPDLTAAEARFAGLCAGLEGRMARGSK
jgi:poly-gamma-glutamate synthesis protein (capsule biosynthesis protein)